jgi:haloacid dehalogenase-like hydrolase
MRAHRMPQVEIEKAPVIGTPQRIALMVDLDGSYLDDRMLVPSENSAIVTILLRSGSSVVFASARLPRSMLKVCSEIHPWSKSVAFNGAFIYGLNGKAQTVNKVLMQESDAKCCWRRISSGIGPRRLARVPSVTTLGHLSSDSLLRRGDPF